MPELTGVQPVSVQFALSATLTNSGVFKVTQPGRTYGPVTAASGAVFTNVLSANDDTGTLPATSYHEVVVTDGSGAINDLRVVVQAALAPTCTLLQLPILLNPTTAARSYVAGQYMVVKKDLYLSSERLIFVNPTVNAFTLMVPSAVSVTGRYTIRNVGTANTVTIKSHVATQTIDGATSTTVGTGGAWTTLNLVSDGSNWRSV